MSESAGDAVIITIHKISGETFTTKARLEDSVREVKAEALSAAGPVLCQRLVLHDVPKKLIFARTAPLFTRQMEELLDRLERNMYTEVRAMIRAPPLCHSCILMILQLMSASPQVTLRTSSGAMPWKDQSWASCSWADCRTMLSDYNQLRANLRSVVQSVTEGDLKKSKVKAAKASLEELGGAAAPGRLCKVFCEFLARFALEIFKFYEEGQQFIWHPDASDPLGSVELRDGVPLSVYVEAKTATNEDSDASARLDLALLIDLDPAFHALLGHAKEQLEGLRALKELGGRCPERLLEAVCGCFGGDDKVADEALHCIRAVLQPSADLAAQFLLATPSFSQSSQAIQAALFLGPGAPEVLAGLASGLLGGNRKACLEAFEELEPRVAPAHSVRCLLESLFQRESVESMECIPQALARVNSRDHEGLVEGLLGYFGPERPGWVLTRASFCATLVAQGEEERLVQALRAALSYVHEQKEFLQICTHLLGLSPAAKPVVLEALCRELHQATCTKLREELLEEIGKLAAPDDPAVLKALVTFLLQSESLLKLQGDFSTLRALKILSQLDQSETFLRQGSRHLLRALASSCASGCWDQRTRKCLIKLASEQGGIGHEALVELCQGLRCQNAMTRRSCCKIWAQVEKKEPQRARRLLLEMIGGEEYAWAKQAAITLLDLGEIQKAGSESEDVRATLLRVAEDVSLPLPLRSEALGALRPLARDGRNGKEVRAAALRCIEEGDAGLVLKALELLAEEPPIPSGCLERVLRSSDPDVLLFALSAFLGPPDGDLAASLLEPFLHHRCLDVAVSSTRALGRLRGDRLAAIAALERGGCWPETREAVRRAREEALRSLAQGGIGGE
ncbi:unnamed protein product [Symbiodinium sp. KB8]|nr:unnamed protein product [Symbiodinium sp. KB8]